ncbi:MAG TPA: protein kinase [Kofleriaceae bacterium]|nr:protein kinase [Kofleriaceae bacterium]
MGTPSDSDLDVGEPVEREGHETLLPSVTRSVLSTKSFVEDIEGRDSFAAGEIEPPARPSAHGSVAPAGSLEEAVALEAEKPRGARSGDIVGGRYVVEGQLGRGGMGRVLRVRHSALGKPFALKLIKSAIATNPKIRELFYREARLASALTHDNICSIVDFGQDGLFGLFMVMELLEGQTVHARLRHSGRFAAKVACDIMWQVADATRFIHSRQILHGDIKTENMFMVRTPAQRRLIKLLDFGLSRADLGHNEGVDGTPEYLAPERIEGAPASQASDIYALGVVFFELLTAKLPFVGDTKEVFRQHRKEPFPMPSKYCDGEALDERADDLVRRATAKDPADRHPDVGTFLYELRTLMQMLGMDQGGGGRRRAVAPDGARDRSRDDSVKAGAEIFRSVSLPMASSDPSGKVRAANPAFLEFIGVAGNAGGLQLRDSALPEVYPTLFEDLEQVAQTRRPIKRVIYLNEGGDRVIEAAVVLSAAPSAAEVTAGEIFIVLHPLRSLLS